MSATATVVIIFWGGGSQTLNSSTKNYIHVKCKLRPNSWGCTWGFYLQRKTVTNVLIRRRRSLCVKTACTMEQSGHINTIDVPTPQQYDGRFAMIFKSQKMLHHTSKSSLTDRCYWRYTDSKRLLRCVNDLWNGTKWSDEYKNGTILQTRKRRETWGKEKKKKTMTDQGGMC